MTYVLTMEDIPLFSGGFQQLKAWSEGPEFERAVHAAAKTFNDDPVNGNKRVHIDVDDDDGKLSYVLKNPKEEMVQEETSWQDMKQFIQDMEEEDGDDDEDVDSKEEESSKEEEEESSEEEEEESSEEEEEESSEEEEEKWGSMEADLNV